MSRIFIFNPYLYRRNTSGMNSLNSIITIITIIKRTYIYIKYYIIQYLTFIVTRKAVYWAQILYRVLSVLIRVADRIFWTFRILKIIQNHTV